MDEGFVHRHRCPCSCRWSKYLLKLPSLSSHQYLRPSPHSPHAFSWPLCVRATLLRSCGMVLLSDADRRRWDGIDSSGWIQTLKRQDDLTWHFKIRLFMIKLSSTTILWSCDNSEGRAIETSLLACTSLELISWVIHFMSNNRDSDLNPAFLLSSEHKKSSQAARLFASDDLTKSYILHEHEHILRFVLSVGFSCLVVLNSPVVVARKKMI